MYYFAKRILLVIPTLFLILTINFVIINSAPGGPIEHMMYKGGALGGEAGSSVGMGGVVESSAVADEDDIAHKLRVIYGYDKSATERFWMMIKNYLTFNLGNSFVYDISVSRLIVERMMVSAGIAIIVTLLIYSIAIPLGINQALGKNKKFNSVINFILIACFALPDFLLAVLLINFFVSGTYWSIFPLRGLTSANWLELGTFARIKDVGWHLVLPVISLAMSGFAFLTALCRNFFMEELGKSYVTTAFAKGLSERQVVYGHVFRNACMTIFISIPRKIVKIMFGGALLVEVMFSIDGFGLLTYEAIGARDYPIIFGVVYVTSLIQLTVNIINDLFCYLFDKRINFDKL